MRMRVHKSTCARRKHKDAPKERTKNEWNKWKNHFYEMKGDVGMSLHKKERNKKMPTPRHKVTHNLDVKMLCCLLCLMHS